MSRNFILLIYLLSPFLSFSQIKDVKAGDIHIRLNAKGFIESISNEKNHREYLYKDTSTALITLAKGKERFKPKSLRWINDSIGEMEFESVSSKIQIKFIEKSAYAVMEVIRIESESNVDALIWGPFPISINKIVGEVIGVVRDDDIAIGLQVLNLKTLGGDFPNNEGSTWERGIAAYKKNWGSTIQAYSINRIKERTVDAWGGNFKNMPVQPIEDGSIAGSKIALFSCNTSLTLDILEKIELGEGLPHPTIDGKWYKRSKYFGHSYMISNFGENEMDEMIRYTKEAGLFSLYHEGPFQSWGHFILDSSQFPKGRKSLKSMANKAHAAGLKMGIHTLTNFINTNDPYVTPIPDNRLINTGSSILMKDIDENTSEIEVAAPDYFLDTLNNSLHTVRIGKELIRYKYVSSTPPYFLKITERGAFGTYKTSHLKGESVGKLMDHPYNVFFPNLELHKEIAGNLADLLNETNVDHIDFDGFEGGLSTGQGDFGVETFAKEVYDKMKHPLINGTSISKNFYWHIGSYYNWGEPWYGGFKESMQQYRIDNQGLFDRNFMPHMMGWYLLTENTTLSEMEWMLARAAGYNAGFAMVARPTSLRKNPSTNILLNAIKEWEDARLSSAFNEDTKNKMKDPRNEFHLEKIGAKKWKLYFLDKTRIFDIKNNDDSISFPNTWIDGQPVIFIKSTSDTVTIKSITIKIDQNQSIVIHTDLLAGQSLISEGGNTVIKYDTNGKILERIKLDKNIPNIKKGNCKIITQLECEDNGKPHIELQLKGIGEIKMVSGS
ncbi:MAG: hypothetical protein ACO29O_05900 [Chitinophagaceae bacterium]